MFDGKITAKSLIEQIKEEADIAIPIPNEDYLAWLNTAEQLIYSEVIREQAEIVLEEFSINLIETAQLSTPNGEDNVRFEDVVTVFAGNEQLIKSSLLSGWIFPNTYFKVKNNIGLNLKKQPKTLKIVYVVRPKTKTTENYGELSVNIPPEFLELIKAKLRGEAYKLANEDALAAKWLSDYNVLVETFKMWIENKSAGGVF